MHTASSDLSWLSWKGSCFGHIFPEWWVSISHVYLEVKKCSNVASSAGRDFPNTLTFNSDLLLFVLNSQILPSCFKLLCMSNVFHTIYKQSPSKTLAFIPEIMTSLVSRNAHWCAHGVLGWARRRSFPDTVAAFRAAGTVFTGAQGVGVRSPDSGQVGWAGKCKSLKLCTF